MRKAVFLFLLLGCLISYSQDNDSLVFKEFFYKNGKKSSEGFLRNGKPDYYWKNFYENGILKSEGNRKDYLLDSLWIFYNDTGEIVSKINYKKSKKNGKKIDYYEDRIVEETYLDDVLHGISKVYYPNGNIKEYKKYSMGTIDSLHIEYSEEGLMVMIAEYDNGRLKLIQHINRRDYNGLKQGVWKTFYEGTMLVNVECNYVNDKLNGYLKEYSKEGEIIKIEKYKNGELLENAQEIETPTPEVKYYTNGVIREKGFYRRNMKDGIWINYDSLANIQNIRIYKQDILLETGLLDKQGLKQGEWIEFYETGQIKGKGKYIDGNKHGHWQYMFENGKILQEGNYINGLFDGEWKWYYSNGNILREEFFKDGLEEGMMIEYNKDGSIVTKGKYEKGKKTDNWVLTVANQKEEGAYRYDERDGIWKHYYETGNISFEGEYVDGDAEGKHIYYYENGNIEKEGTYKRNLKHGVWKFFTEDGILIITIEFEEGLEIKIDNKVIN